MLQRRVTPGKKYLRRTLRALALAGTILLGILVFAVVASQTTWFKNWLRRFVVNEANQYLNGTLTVGTLGGNLFTGFELGDVAIDMNGEHVVTLKKLEVKYRLQDVLSKGRTIQQIRLEQPFVLVRHDRNGWNLANLAKPQAQEANRQGPGHALSLPDIEIVDGRAVVDDRLPSASYTIPSRIDGLNAKAGFEYAPVHYSLTLNQFSFTGHAPDLTVTSITGRAGTRGDGLNVENLTVRTPDSVVTVAGDIQNYLSRPNLNVSVTSSRLSVPEFAAVLPPARGYALHPSIDLKAQGTEDNLHVTLSEQSEAGALRATLTADALAPGFGARGDIDVRDLDLAPILKDRSQKSDITAHAKIDLQMASAPANAPALDRTRGTFVLDAPRIVAAGYAADGVKVTGDVRGRHIGFDARANAYGGSAAAKGFVVAPAATGAPTQFDVTGSARHLNLRSLPASLNAPRAATNINANSFHAAGAVSASRTNVDGTITLGQSTLPGATLTDGTAATFRYAAAGRRSTPAVSYTAKGGVRNVDLYALGQAFRVPALSKPDYASRINADFDVRGTGTAPATMAVDASATLTNSALMGGTIPRLALDAHLADGALQGRANGELRGFDPARLTGNSRYTGHVNGAVNASFGVSDINAPITPASVTADGQVTLEQTDVAGLRIDTADIQGQYANRRGTLRQASIKGPDFELDASGPIALDDTGSSNVKYHVIATDLAQLARLGNVSGVSGSATIDGALTGNASSLRTTGTLDGSNLGYQANKALDLNSTFDVTVPNLEFARAQVKANTTGTFIQAGGLQINELRAGTTYASQKLDFQVHVAEAPHQGGAGAANAAAPLSGARELDAGGTVLFHPDHQEIHLPSLSLRTQGIEWHTAPGAEATVQYGGERVQLQNVRLVNGSQSLAIDGAFPLGTDGAPGAVTVNAQHVDLSQIDKLAMLNRGISGTLDANAKITGTTKAPAVDGRVQIANGGFQQFKYDSFTANANYTNDRVTLDAKLTQSPGVELTATGTIPMTALRPNPPGVTGHVAPSPGDQLDVHVTSSRINLGIVQSFTTLVTDVTGTLEADVRVTGSGEDPHLNGYVALQGGAFAVPDAGTSFSGLTTRIDLQPDRVTVPQFRVLDAHGDALTIGGQLAVHERQAGAVDVAIDSDNFKLMDNELGDVHVETHLKLTGEVRHPRIEGDVRMDQARLELDRILLQFASPYSEEALPEVVTSADSTRGTDKGAEQATDAAFAKGRQVNQQQRRLGATAESAGIGSTGALAPVAFNIHFVVPDNMVVRGQDLRPGGATAMQVGNVNATLGADLQVRKRADGPIVLRGTANTVRGFYEFQGRRFDLVRGGNIRFLGLPEINPNLDLSATRLIPNSGVTAKIHITGSMRAPELALSSDPPLDESDILSLIVFNRNVNELGTGERASLADTAGSIASGFIASPLSRSVGRALDVDLFEITTSDPETGETAGGITLGKQVSDKAFVRYRQQFGQRSFTQFQLEYDLTRFLRFQGSVAPETTTAANRLTQRRVERAGADLIFFFSY